VDPVGEEAGLLRHGTVPDDLDGSALGEQRRVGGPDDVGCHQRDERIDPSSPGGREERVDDPPVARCLRGLVGGRRIHAFEASPRTAGQLLRVRRRGVQHDGDLAERYAEEVVQDVGHPLGGGESAQEHQERPRDVLAP